jgi:hypothetical protein
MLPLGFSCEAKNLYRFLLSKNIVIYSITILLFKVRGSEIGNLIRIWLRIQPRKGKLDKFYLYITELHQIFLNFFKLLKSKVWFKNEFNTYVNEIAETVPIYVPKRSDPETILRTVYQVDNIFLKYLSSAQDPWREPRAPTLLQPLPHLQKWTLRYTSVSKVLTCHVQ